MLNLGKAAGREKKYQKPNTLSLCSARGHRRARKMNVRIHYLGLVKTYTNQSQDEMELKEGATLSDLLNKLAADFGKQFMQEIYEPGVKDVKPMFTIMVNGVIIGQLNGLETKLKDRDTIILMPLMTGG